MIKKTLYFGNPVQLRVKNEQLRIIRETDPEVTIPIEDIGFIVIDHYGITISHHALSALLTNNVAIITTDETHLPVGIFWPLHGNQEQGDSIRAQIESNLSLKKRLWQQTVQAKIKNQAGLLKKIGLNSQPLENFLTQVKSDDATNQEAAAAKVYWQLLFDPIQFRRHRYGKPPNNLLNYGYAILRGVIARAICGTGLLPIPGIHHRNRYNGFPLADDIMEPYRPFVDELVWQLVMDEPEVDVLRPEIKRRLLEVPVLGVQMNQEKKPLHLAAALTAASLKQCFLAQEKKISYPD